MAESPSVVGSSRFPIVETLIGCRDKIPISECNDYNYLKRSSSLCVSEGAYYVFLSKVSSIPVSEVVLPIQEKKSSRMVIRENVIGIRDRIPIRESTTVIVGIIITENIMSNMSKELIIHEHIRSRILYDVEVLDRSHIKVKWYGESVPYVCIFKKNVVDLAYPVNPIATVRWGVNEYVVEVDDTSCNIKLLGLNNTGESSEYNVGESNMIDMFMNTLLPLNEKSYFIDVSLVSKYEFEVDL